MTDPTALPMTRLASPPRGRPDGADAHAGLGPLSRRRVLRGVTSLVLGTALLSACDPVGDVEASGVPDHAHDVLSEAGLSAPPGESEVTDGPLQQGLAWSRIVTFSGPSGPIEDWVAANFDTGIESHAVRDDMPTAVEQFGTGVQRKGDRIADGVHGSVFFIVVVGQEDEPVVHVAVRRPE